MKAIAHLFVFFAKIAVGVARWLSDHPDIEKAIKAIAIKAAASALLVLLVASGARAQTPVVAAGVFHGCAVTGDGKSKAIEEADRLKNRSTVPASVTDYDLGELFAGISKLDPGEAIRFRAVVSKVKPGGSESVNCHATDLALRDTHIELMPLVSYTGLRPKHPIIVEVSPRWRAAMKAIGVDWSTATLEKTLPGHIVEFVGWPFDDAEHANAADDTHPGGKHNWRTTPWEPCHPCTSITVIQ